jgi:outer membrane protein TolC
MMTRKKMLFISMIAIVLGSFSLWVAFSWIASFRTITTDNAYVHADITAIAPKVAGYVTEVPVRDNAIVKAGDLLFAVDARDYAAKVDQARANVQAAESSVSNVEATTTLQYAIIRQAEAQFASAAATQKRAAQEYARQKRLHREKATTEQKFEDAVIVAGLPSSLLLRRPDILKAEASLKAANADIGASRAAFLPLVNLTVQGGWQSDEFHTLFTPTSTLYALASSLVAPIFQGGRLIAQHDAAIARREELVARYQQAALSAFLETDTAIAANSFLAKEEENRVVAVREANEAYRIVNIQYREGATDFLNLLDAQRTLLTAQDAQITVTLARLNTTVGLFKTLGG